jgi:site-specific DNA recombinase
VRLIGYARVSTDEQATSGLGLEAQEATLRRAAEFRGYDLVEIIRDEGPACSTRSSASPCATSTAWLSPSSTA